MFETAIAGALMSAWKYNEDQADRRAFYGPDCAPSQDEPRRKVRLPRFVRRGAKLA